MRLAYLYKGLVILSLMYPTNQQNIHLINTTNSLRTKSFSSLLSQKRPPTVGIISSNFLECLDNLCSNDLSEAISS